ncbi:MAG TPA: surface-adhesin E family protein [Usitatibacter sp.]|nr:surface-adhesin E family protein [Usitatibacter sp.]
MKKVACLAVAVSCVALQASAVQWTPIRSEKAAKLSVDSASMQRKGDQVNLKYLIDYAKPQGDVLSQVRYRSVVTAVAVRCKTRTLSLGTSELFSHPGATGTLLATAVPTGREGDFTAIEKGTSDEDLWRHACGQKGSGKKP